MVDMSKSFTNLTIINNMPNSSQYEESLISCNPNLNEAALSISNSVDEPALVTII